MTGRISFANVLRVDVLRHCPKPLVKYMARHGLSQAEFGRRIGASQAAVSLWLTGKGRMSVKRAAKIEKRLKGEISRRDLFPKFFEDAA